MAGKGRQKREPLSSLFEWAAGEVCAAFPGLVAGTPLAALKPGWHVSLYLQQMAGEFKTHFPDLAKDTAFAVAPRNKPRRAEIIMPEAAPKKLAKLMKADIVRIPGPAYYNIYYHPRKAGLIRLLHPDDSRYTIAEYPFAAHLKKEGSALPAAHKPTHSGFANTRQYTFLIGDHEIGHLIFMHDPYYKSARLRFSHQYAEHLNECFADTYALLRHYARFGMDTALDDAEILSRARLAAHAYHDYAFTHMTAACLFSVRRMAQNQDITKFTPTQAAELALKITKAYAARGKNEIQMENLAAFDKDARASGLKSDFVKYARAMADKAQSGDLSREVVRACIDATRIFHEFNPADYRALAAISHSLAQSQQNLTPPAP